MNLRILYVEIREYLRLANFDNRTKGYCFMVNQTGVLFVIHPVLLTLQRTVHSLNLCIYALISLA